MAKNKIARFARGGDAGDGSGGIDDSPTFDFASGNEDYDYDPYANWSPDDVQPTDEAEGTWTDLGNGQWSYTDAFGNTQTYDDPDYQAPGDTQSPSGEQYGPVEQREINGVNYTQRPDGSWVDDEGITYTDDEIQAETDNPTNPAEVGATWTRNPDGSQSQTRPDGLIITKNNDGTTTTQNPDGSTHTTTPGGDTTQTTPRGENPNGVAKPPTSTGGPSGIDKLIDKFKTPDGGVDWAKLLKAGLAAGVGIQGLKGVVDTMQNKNPSPDYQGQIDMGLTFNRTMNPQDHNRRPGSASTPFFASNTFGPAGSAPQGIAAIPNAAALAPGVDGMMYKGGSKDFDEAGGGQETIGYTKPLALPQTASAVPSAPEQKQSIGVGASDAMRKDWGSYFDTAKAGSTVDWGGGTLTMGDDGQAVYKAANALNGGNVLNRASIDNPNTLQSLMSSAPGIAKQWGEQYGVQSGNNENDQKYWDNVLAKQGYAAGGIAQLAYAGGGPTEPRYIRGDTDGMADEVPALIDGKQPAAVAHGEFIWPADVVSHLGNGNSDAGAKKLHQAMDAIRKARTGTKAQGKEIDPDKFLPGMKGKASGGITDAIPRFAAGGTAAVTGVNSWAGPYATNLLSQTNALGNDMIANPGNYVYQGQRVADTNALQNKAYTGAMNMAITNPGVTKASNMMEQFATKLGDMPAYQAASVGSGYSTGPAYAATKFDTKEFNQDEAAKYMNPYLKLALDPQLEEARRQAEITRMTNAGRLVGSGAFGGGRQAIMEAEGDRNLGTNLANITGQGYNKAYDSSMSQFNADQARRLQADQAGEQSKQFGHSSSMTDRANSANFGLQAAQINENSRMQGARLGLDSIIAGGNMASNWGNFMNNADANTRNNINTISGLGNALFSRDQAGLTSDMNRFNEEAALPGQALKFKKDMLTGLPVQNTTAVSPGTSLAEQLAGLGLSIDDISKLMGTT